MDKKWWTLLAVCAGTFMLLLDVTIVVVALPEIQTSLHATFGDVQWVIDAYALTLASLAPHDRGARRPIRPPETVRHRAHDLHAGLAHLRFGPEPDDADHLAQRPGHRRSDRVRHLARIVGR